MTPRSVVRAASAGIALAGVRVRRVLSADLFREVCGLSPGGGADAVAQACQDRWTDLAAAIAALPEPAEFLLVVGGDPAGIVFAALGRGEEAEASCTSRLASLRTLLATHLDYAEIEGLDREANEALLRTLTGPAVLEIRRRLVRIPVGHGDEPPLRIFGFGSEPGGDLSDATDGETRFLEHLSPWRLSDDPWRRLLEVLAAEGGARRSSSTRSASSGRPPKSSRGPWSRWLSPNRLRRDSCSKVEEP